MARDNFSYQKYQKELARKKKAEEKKQKKLDRKAMAALPGAGEVPVVNEPEVTAIDQKVL